jgi:hypothetical protein
MRITDIAGKQVDLQQVEAKTGANIVTIERNNLSAGVYILSLTNGSSTATRRFTISE